MNAPLYFIILAVLLTVVTGASPARADQQLFDAIGTRLALMKGVAHYKFANQQAVEDLSREAIVLEQAVDAGRRINLRPSSTERFFKAQITAAKTIQQYWFVKWQTTPPSAPAPDLSEIRTELLDLGDRIIARLNAPIAQNLKRAFIARTKTLGLPEIAHEALFDALVDLEFYDGYTAQLKDSGVLRIGVTLDYAPFSFGSIEAPQGIDIDLGNQLAAALGLTVQWVPTTWPNLTQDFTKGRFDIAMGGVSITPERSALGHFSVPYHVGGKTPIGRCRDQDRFKSLGSIDQSDVRVIVNPGGTNARFANATIKHAGLQVFPDNRLIFDEIRAHRADVMFTDAIEVALKASRHPDLCPLMPGVYLTHQEKGIWLPNDPALKSTIDAWLTARIADHHIDGLIERWLQVAP